MLPDFPCRVSLLGMAVGRSGDRVFVSALKDHAASDRPLVVTWHHWLDARSECSVKPNLFQTDDHRRVAVQAMDVNNLKAGLSHPADSAGRAEVKAALVMTSMCGVDVRLRQQAQVRVPYTQSLMPLAECCG